MPFSYSTWTEHNERCRVLFDGQNTLPVGGASQLGKEYSWQGTKATWGTADTYVIFGDKQKLLPAWWEDLQDPKTCEAFNEFIRQKSPEHVYGTLPWFDEVERCPGVVTCWSGQERRCPESLQGWSQALLLKSSDGYGYTPFCLTHGTVDGHKRVLAIQDAEFAKFRKAQQHQDASSAAGTSVALSPAVVPSSVSREADSKKRPNSSERKAPLRKPQRSSRRRRKRSTKLCPSEQDNTSVTALANEVATEISQACKSETGGMTKLSFLPSVNPSTALTSTAVPPASTSHATFAEPATPFDPQVPHHDEGFTYHDKRFTTIPSSAESNDSSDGNYGQYLQAQDLDSPFDLNAFAQLDEMDNDWKDQYETSKSQYSDYMSSAPPDNGDTGLDWTHQQSNPSL